MTLQEIPISEAGPPIPVVSFEDLVHVSALELDGILRKSKRHIVSLGEIRSDELDFEAEHQRNVERIDSFLSVFGLIGENAVEAMVSESDSLDDAFEITSSTRKNILRRLAEGQSIGKLIFDKGWNAIPIELGEDGEYQGGYSEVRFALPGSRELSVFSDGEFWMEDTGADEQPELIWQMAFKGQVEQKLIASQS